MYDQLEILRMAQGLARHAGARQATVARNIANANTPGYRTHDVAPFADLYNTAPGPGEMRRTRPGHLSAADAATLPGFPAEPQRTTTAAPNGNTVSIESEILKSAEVKQQHDMALSVYQNALGVLRAAISRR